MSKVYYDHDIALAFKYGSNYLLPDPDDRDPHKIFKGWLRNRDAAIRAAALEDLLMDFEGWKYHGEFKEFGSDEMRSDEEFVRYRYLAAENYLERLQDTSAFDV